MIDIRKNSYDAVVALGGIGFDEEGNLAPDSIQRTEAAAGLVIGEGVAPNLIITGASPVVFRGKLPTQVLAVLMRKHAISEGMPADRIFTEEGSVDTIGNAVLTKQKITDPRDWRRLLVVTSGSHLERSMRIFRHVMGPSYVVEGVSSGETAVRGQRYHEVMGGVALRAVMHGTEPGDDETIKERLFGIVPGYADVSMSRRMGNLIRGLI